MKIPQGLSSTRVSKWPWETPVPFPVCVRFSAPWRQAGEWRAKTDMILELAIPQIISTQNTELHQEMLWMSVHWHTLIRDSIITCSVDRMIKTRLLWALYSVLFLRDMRPSQMWEQVLPEKGKEAHQAEHMVAPGTWSTLSCFGNNQCADAFVMIPTLQRSTDSVGRLL